MECSIKGCSRPVFGRGWCSAHYQRWRKHGDPERIVRVFRVGGEVCSVDGCVRDAAQLTPIHLCAMHKSRLWKTGSVGGADTRATPYRKTGGANHCGKRLCPAYVKFDRHLRYRREADEYKARAAAYAAANPEKKRSYGAKWKAANGAVVAADRGARRDSMAEATPHWLTAAQWAQMNAIYAEAKRLTRETGIDHHVDHIVPIRGKNVRGLHVPWNLRIVTATENLKKGCKLTDP